MSSLPVGPVAWSDGMLIETQHFQQLERYLSHQVASRLEQTVDHGWGFTQLDVDQDGLGLGRLGLRHARGVFQDGTAFLLPSYDPLPAPLETEHAQPGNVAYLAIQAARSGGPEMAFGDAASASRYRAAATDVPDLAVGLDAPGTPRNLTIETGQLLTRLCWKAQLRSDEVALPIARVLGRSGSRAVLLDSRFIPPPARYAGERGVEFADRRAAERAAGAARAYVRATGVIGGRRHRGSDRATAAAGNRRVPHATRPS